MNFYSIGNYLINLDNVTTINIDNDDPSEVIFRFNGDRAARFAFETEDDALHLMNEIEGVEEAG